MSPVAKNAMKYGVKYGVKYGPQAKVAWDVAGKQVQAAAKAQADNLAARRTAFAEAETLVDGSVLRRVWEGRPVWLVLSGDRPRSAYPPVTGELAHLLADADLSKRITPEQHRQAQLRARARRAGKKAGQVSRQAAEVGRSAARASKRRALGPPDPD
jgi:hypothetical protein